MIRLFSLSLIVLLLWLSPQTTTDQPCITLAGDSIAHGDMVFLVPGHGFGVLRGVPLSVVMDGFLEQYGLSPYEIRDRSASAAFLSDLGRFPYSQTEDYEALLQDDCEAVVLGPWANDLSIDRDQAAAAHVQDLETFIADVQAVNPDTQFLVLGFYYAQRADFVERYSPGYTDENVALFNEALFEACTSGALATEDITCLRTDTLYEGLDYQHVVRQTSQADVLAALYEDIPADVAPFFEVFWRDNPDGLVIGDGVHLNEPGKVILAEAIVKQLVEMLSVAEP